MKAVLHIFYLLAFYVHKLTAEKDSSYRVNAMNHILSQPGWSSLKLYDDFAINVKWMEEAERRITVDDFLASGSDGIRVHYRNMEYKIRQAHQFLSCHYADQLTECYDYTICLFHQCKTINVLSEFLQCVSKVLDMIGIIDEAVERMVGALSCIYLLSTKEFDSDVSNALNVFKSYYNNLNYNLESLDKMYHDEIIKSTEANMATVIQQMVEFYSNNCEPVLYVVENNGVSEAAEYILGLAKRYPPLAIVNNISGIVISKIDEALKDFNQFSFGFKYESSSKKTSLTYNEINDE